jgi:hypothetical protein
VSSSEKSVVLNFNVSPKIKYPLARSAAAVFSPLNAFVVLLYVFYSEKGINENDFF